MLVLLIVAALAGLSVVSFLLGFRQSEHYYRGAAAAIGAAEWRCDPLTGKTVFCWLPRDEPD